MKLPLFVCASLPSSCIYATDTNLDGFDLESLLAADVQITSAMKRTQTASETGASVYVLSNEKIGNSGVTSIAQALELVPGMEVRQIDGNKWAIGIRAPAGRFTSKLLVMVDGQSIYTPSFSGVYWEALNIPLYDIERIEVIKGQGGLLWGSNATNGVVNIITKHSIDTRSTLGHIKAGSNLKHQVSFRTGDDLSLTRHSSYRVYGSTERSRKSDEALFWDTTRDKSEKNSFGGRIDITLNDDDSLLIQADYTNMTVGQTTHLPSLTTYKRQEISESEKRQHAQLMLRMDSRLSDTSNQMIQASMYIQEGKQVYFDEKSTHFDIDYQLNMLTGTTQINMGLNYRYIDVPFTPSAFINNVNNIDFITQYGGFIQTSISILPNELDLIIGNKSERNSFTGWEHQPSLRLTWTPNKSHFIWGAMSHGVRIPSLTEFDYETLLEGAEIADYIVTGIPEIDNTRIKTILKGDSSTKPETSLSTELGYRINQEHWKVDLSLFYTESKNTLGVNTNISDVDLAAFSSLLGDGDTLGALNYLSNTIVEVNFLKGIKLISTGGDIVLSWQPNSHIQSEIGYNYTIYDYENAQNSLLAVDGSLNQLFFSSTFQLTDNQTLFTLLKWENGEGYETNNYISLDLSWGWQISPKVHLSLTGNNLLNSSNVEYGRTNDTLTVPTYIDRSFLLGFTFNF